MNRDYIGLSCILFMHPCSFAHDTKRAVLKLIFVDFHEFRDRSLPLYLLFDYRFRNSFPSKCELLIRSCNIYYESELHEVRLIRCVWSETVCFYLKLTSCFRFVEAFEKKILIFELANENLEILLKFQGKFLEVIFGKRRKLIYIKCIGTDLDNGSRGLCFTANSRSHFRIIDFSF